MYTLAELAGLLDGVLHGNAEQAVQGVASLGSASETTLAYFDNPALLCLLESTQAAAVLLTAGYVSHCPVNSIVVANPLQSMTRIAQMFSPLSAEPEGIHPDASVSASASLGKKISIGAHSIIADGVVLGDEVRIGANSVIEAGVRIGGRTIINHGVYIHSGSILGSDIVIDSGVVLGASPFNSFKMQGVWLRDSALGGVVIGDKVQLGANTVVDRGALGDTFIGEGVHIDNLVQIAHDVTIGAHSAVAGCAAIGAFARIGSHCIIGGASCLAANVHLVDDIVISGMSTVNKSLAKPGLYSSGTMVSEHRRWRRNAARFRRLDDYVLRLTRLEKEWQQSLE